MSSPASTDHRACPVCGASLEGRRRDAIYDRPACRREGNRLLRLAAGKPDTGYRSLDEYAARRRRRANAAVGE